MTNSSFRFEIGDFKCMVVSDGTIMVPGPQPKGQTERPRQAIPVLCLFIDTGEHKILVDTGCGTGFQPTAGKLVQNLEAEGVNCADIDMIIYTHGDGDHVGGSFDLNSRPIFPNAHSFVSKKELEGWVSQQRPMFATVRKNFLPVADQFNQIEDNAEVLPGIKFVVAPGHTPGNTALELSSRANRLLCIGDLSHSPIEFTTPDYYSHFDVSPEQAIRSRDQVLSGAAESGVLVFACHYTFPGLGHVVKKDNILSWQPL